MRTDAVGHTQEEAVTGLLSLQHMGLGLAPSPGSRSPALCSSWSWLGMCRAEPVLDTWENCENLWLLAPQTRGQAELSFLQLLHDRALQRSLFGPIPELLLF